MTDDPTVTVEETDDPTLSPEGTGRQQAIVLTARHDTTGQAFELHLYVDPGMSVARAILSASNLLTPDHAASLAYDADPAGVAELVAEVRP